ncbi:MAG: hypothetical protein Q4D79_12840 [Propionibacteriaceae bacterium]|nr:hypothetical protein [Propionibacteriaceae bacterium]
MRKRVLAGLAAAAVGIGCLTAAPARAELSITAQTYAVGTAGSDGKAPVWVGGVCGPGASRAVLNFGGFFEVEPQDVPQDEAAEIPTPSPTPSELPVIEPEEKIELSLTNDEFEYIYQASGTQELSATCIYPDGNAASTWFTVDATRPSSPTLAALNDGGEPVFYPGGTIDISLDGFAPNQAFEVHLRSTPRLIGTGTTGADGTARVQARIPDDTTPGEHHLTVRAKNGQRALFRFLIGTKPQPSAPSLTPKPAVERPLPTRKYAVPAKKHALTLTAVTPAPMKFRDPRTFRPMLPNTGVS